MKRETKRAIIGAVFVGAAAFTIGQMSQKHTIDSLTEQISALQRNVAAKERIFPVSSGAAVKISDTDGNGLYDLMDVSSGTRRTYVFKVGEGDRGISQGFPSYMNTQHLTPAQFNAELENVLATQR